MSKDAPTLCDAVIRETYRNPAKAYARRQTHDVWLRWIEGETEPEYHGNLRVLKEHYWGKSPSLALMKKNGETKYAPGFTPDQHSKIVTVWDGESWIGGYDPFCTLTCALDYARRAYAYKQRRSA